MKKACLLFFFAFLPVLGLVGCLFDSSGDALSSWLKDEGLPSSYKVQTLDIDSIYPASFAVGFDSTPRAQYYQGVLGSVNGMNHELVMDFCFKDASFFTKFDSADSAAAFLALYPDSGFYAKAGLSDSLPLSEDLKIHFSWKIELGAGSSYLDSIGDIKDSVWLRTLRGWPDSVIAFDTTYAFKISSLDSAVRIDLPDTLVRCLQKIQNAARVQLRMSAPGSKRLYRFTGPSSDDIPFMRMRVTNSSYKNVWPFRMAIVSTSKETCSGCAVLHGGVLESLVVDLPGEKVLSALQDFYGDDFPYTEGDSMDVRQAVVLARLTMPRSSSTEGSELGFPVQVAAASFIDSSGKQVQVSEAYKLNKDYIVKNGHPNVVFFPGDSLALQMTYGMRSFINRAASGVKLRVVLRLGYSMLAPYDTLYYDHENDAGDSVYIFMDYLTYSRYDFTKEMKSPMSLKLWLATKRGDDE